ncbi:MAG: RNA polymerase sigma factor [Candidatus Neomarinimicrobiota bacterium]
MTSDWDSLQAARAGDESAWRLLYQRHSPTLLRTTLFVTGSHDAAEDIVQEAFIRLLKRRLPPVRGNFQAYLHTIAYRLALKEIQRSQRYHPGANPHTIRDGAPSPLEAYLNSERDKGIAAIIDALPQPQRDVLVLRFYGGHSYREIARMTRTPLGTVKSRMFHAVRTCRHHLREKGITP